MALLSYISTSMRFPAFMRNSSIELSIASFSNTYIPSSTCEPSPSRPIYIPGRVRMWSTSESLRMFSSVYCTCSSCCCVFISSCITVLYLFSIFYYAINTDWFTAKFIYKYIGRILLASLLAFLGLLQHCYLLQGSLQRSLRRCAPR